MKTMNLKPLGALLGACILATACVSQQPRNDYYGPNSSYGHYVERGSVESIAQLHNGGGTSGVGLAGGALVGGLLGHQMGKGTGKTVMTIAGAAAGAYAGNEIEKGQASGGGFRIGVRLRDGRIVTVDQSSVNGLRIGDRVRIEQNRVYPDY